MSYPSGSALDYSGTIYMETYILAHIINTISVERDVTSPEEVIIIPILFMWLKHYIVLCCGFVINILVLFMIVYLFIRNVEYYENLHFATSNKISFHDKVQARI